MKFVLFSDIHNGYKFENEVVPDKDAVLLLPGDLHEFKRTNRYKELIKVLTDSYKEVLLVPGNHEYYGSNIISVNKKMTLLQQEFSNFHFLQNSSVVIDDIFIVGSTLWTDFDNGNALTKYDAGIKMNDYKHIRHGTEKVPYDRKLRPTDTEFFHYESKKYIRSTIDEARKNGYTKILVMTHHAPSHQSIHQSFKNSDLNGAYCSDMDDFIIDLSPDVWVHGHVHNSFDYNIDATRILCNPRGYDTKNGSYENYNFDKQFSFLL